MAVLTIAAESEKGIFVPATLDPAGSGKVLLAVRIVFLDRVQNLQIHVVRANQYICIFSQFSEFRIQNMHSTLYVYFQSIFRNMHQNMR